MLRFDLSVVQKSFQLVRPSVLHNPLFSVGPSGLHAGEKNTPKRLRTPRAGCLPRGVAVSDLPRVPSQLPNLRWHPGKPFLLAVPRRVKLSYASCLGGLEFGPPSRYYTTSMLTESRFSIRERLFCITCLYQIHCRGFTRAFCSSGRCT